MDGARMTFAQGSAASRYRMRATNASLRAFDSLNNETGQQTKPTPFRAAGGSPSLRKHSAGLITIAFALCFFFAPSLRAIDDISAYATVTVPKVKTSIYVGSVTLALEPFERGADGAYAARYKATVVPFFFFNESGSMNIPISDEQLAQLERGERIAFSGSGKNSGGSARRVEGHAEPASPGAKTGKIKVRVFVTKKTELIFNTTYTFARPAQVNEEK